MIKFKYTLYTITLLTIAFFQSCDNKFYDYNTSASLEFSSDTISFDTIFTNRISISGILRVYNRSNKPVKISNIKLVNSNSSVFSISVDGFNGDSYSDLRIGEKDSISVFIKCWVDKQNSEDFKLYSDKILFDVNSKNQEVILQAYAVDPNNIYKKVFERDTILDSKRPYHIHDTITVHKAATLTLKEGVSMHFSKNSALIVNGNINIEGSFDKRVTLTGDRQGEFQQGSPGQWAGIIWNEPTKASVINYAIIKNCKKGLYMYSSKSEPTIEISNSIINNINTEGLYLSGVDVKVSNSEITNCGGNNIYISRGGSYQFNHCTISNSGWTFFMPKNCIYIFNESKSQVYTIEKADFNNCIIYGRNRDALKMIYKNEMFFNYNFKNCLLKFEEDSLISDRHSNCVFKENPLFKNAGKNNFNLDEESPAINKADNDVSKDFPLDLNNFDRLGDFNPDIGAYEFNPSKE